MIRKLVISLAGAAALVAGPASAGSDRSPEARLARALEGREAGQPVDCINLRTVRNQQVINRTAILYDAGDVIYVNRPRAGAEALNQYDAHVVRPFSGRLCSIDTIRVVDTTTGTFNGSVFLGEFVPYRRVRH